MEKKNHEAEKRIKELFLIAAVVYVVLFILLTLEFFGLGTIPTWAVEVFLGIIATYAVANARYKNQETEVIGRPGQYFVYLSWLYFILVSAYCFPIGKELTIHVLEAVGGITVIFGGTTYRSMTQWLKK